MGFRAGGRLALAITAAILFAALTAEPLLACETCPPGPNTEGLPANALPIYPQPAEQAVEPVPLRKFARPQIRSARRLQSRKATLSQRARAGKYASRKAGQDDGDGARSVKIAPALAEANAQLVEPARANTPEPSEQAQPAETPADAVQPPSVEFVSADVFNDLDRAAWEANQLPRLMKLTTSDSRAELREADSKWAQTSTIGKLFVAFGALLTIGSAIRMFTA